MACAPHDINKAGLHCRAVCTLYFQIIFFQCGRNDGIENRFVFLRHTYLYRHGIKRQMRRQYTLESYKVFFGGKDYVFFVPRHIM